MPCEDECNGLVLTMVVIMGLCCTEFCNFFSNPNGMQDAGIGRQVFKEDHEQCVAKNNVGKFIDRFRLRCQKDHFPQTAQYLEKMRGRLELPQWGSHVDFIIIIHVQD